MIIQLAAIHQASIQQQYCFFIFMSSTWIGEDSKLMFAQLAI